MVIGFDGSRAFVAGRTGTENYSYQLLKALAKIDHKNQYIIYIRYTLHDAIVQQTVKWPENFEFRIIKFQRLWTQIGLAKQSFQDQLDVLFIPAHTSPLIHKRGLKTVVTVHDLGAEYLPKMHQVKQRLYLKWITKYQLRSATRLIAVSKATKDDLVKKVGIDPKKVEVIYEGYDKALFKPAKGDRLVDTLKQYDLVPESYFLFVGTIQPRKNLERLIKAFAKYLEVAARSVAKNRSTSKSESLNNSLVSLEESFVPTNYTQNSPHFLTDSNFAAPKLVITGSKGWLSDSIYKLPKKLGIGTQVKFLGHVDDKFLPALYSGAIALTFPSLFEGFGLPILEAQACGCPVLTSNVSSMPEVAGKGGLLVNPYSVKAIMEGMVGLQVTGYRLQLIKAGFENVKRFSWEKCARETLEVLENV